MPNADVFSKIASALGMGERSIRFWRFRDGMGNFELSVPEGWKYDENVAVVDGKYTISFQSTDGLCQFTVAVDAQLLEKFRFAKYAKEELESPTSGIFAIVRKSRFHDMPAYVRDYHYSSGTKKFFGGGVMFSTGNIVFSLSWNAPVERQTVMDAVFSHMRKTIVLHKGFVVSRGKGSLREKLREMNSDEEEGNS
ncbi:MAG: hypothetical protein V1861_00335 [Candidatus Micrarchaeota archaeon]